MTPAEHSLYSVHLSTARTWRGGENQIWLLAQGLQQRNQKVMVLAPSGAPLLERCAAARIPVQPLSFCCELDPLGVLRLAALLRREAPDILHLHDGHALLPGQWAAWLAGAGGDRQPISKQPGTFSRVSPRLRVVAQRRTAFDVKGRWKYGRRVDRIIAISAAVRDKLLAAGLPAAKIEVVHSGLEFAPGGAEPLGREEAAREAVALRKRLGMAEGTLLVAHAAALTAEKRQLDCILAVARANEVLKERGHAGVHLALAGTGDQEGLLRQEAARRGLEGQVHLLGFVQDLRPLWAASAMALFTSEAEGLCTSLIEAQGAALPAVVTRAGGMVEVVAAGESGLVVEVGDIEGIAAALVKLAEDAALRERLGRTGARLVRQKFSCAAMVEGALRVYSGAGS